MDFIAMLVNLYGNIQEMLDVFNNENKFGANKFVVGFI